jgi:hypothetical protein
MSTTWLSPQDAYQIANGMSIKLTSVLTTEAAEGRLWGSRLASLVDENAKFMYVVEFLRQLANGESED